jgi:hypothetical protein
VQIVRGTDAEKIHALRLGPAAKLLEVAIESFDFGKESDIERVLIEDADGIVRIGRRDQPISRVMNGLEMTGRHESADARHGKIFQNQRLLAEPNKVLPPEYSPSCSALQGSV